MNIMHLTNARLRPGWKVQCVQLNNQFNAEEEFSQKSMLSKSTVGTWTAAFVLFSQISYQIKMCALREEWVHVTIFEWFPFYFFRLILWLNTSVSVFNISQIILHDTNANK